MKRFALAFLIDLVWCAIASTNIVLVYAGVDTPRWWDIALLYGSLLYIGHFLGTSQRLRGTWIERCWNGIVRVVSGGHSRRAGCAWGEAVTIDDDLDGMGEQYKINHRALALDLVKARRARRPRWGTMLRSGYWKAGLRGWEGKPLWGVYRFYYDGDWWVAFHLGPAWAEWSTTEEDA